MTNFARVSLATLLCGALSGCASDPEKAVNPSDTSVSNGDAGSDATGPVPTQDAGSDLNASSDAGTPDPADEGPDVPNVPDLPEGPDTTTPLGEWCTGQPDDFSFFVTSMDALWLLSGSTPGDLSGGFGGDFGGLEGADEICQTIAAATGFGGKTWRAFLSATDDGNGAPVDAIDRVGVGPWTDANGRLVASSVDGMLAGARPDGDAQSVADLPDECGVPLSVLGDAHDVVTGSNRRGLLADTDPETTCNDWTSSDDAVGSTGGSGPGGITGTVMAGHSFPRRPGSDNGGQWLSDHPLRGCGKGANLLQNGSGSGTCIGCTGGYGAIYCFAQ